jgi:hypothetical protein
MIGKQGLKKPLMDRIAEPLDGLGFIKSIAKQAFFKKTAFGRFAFHLAFVDRGFHIGVVADVALRHDDLENLVFENTSGFIVPAGRRNTSSIGAELGRIRSSGHKEWPVYKISEIDNTAEAIVHEFLSVGMPYLEKYSDKEILFRAFVQHGPDASLLHSIPLRSSLNTIALAYLLGKMDIFTELANRQEAFLTPIPNSGIEIFQEFRKNLETKM